MGHNTINLFLPHSRFVKQGVYAVIADIVMYYYYISLPRYNLACVNFRLTNQVRRHH